LKKPEVDKKALKRSFWGSLSRVIGVGLAAGAGNVLHQIIGDGLAAAGAATIMAIASFAMIWFAEYERESGE
jgi:hypothetical protein